MAATKPDVAFVGLGAMGFGMATHLVKEGYKVTGSDVWAPSVERFVSAGGISASSPREASNDASFLVSMVATADQTTAALFDASTGAIHTLPQNATIIICSTVSPTYIPEVRALLDGKFERPDIQLIDCPVSGGTVRAADGTLTILASGPDVTLAHSKSLLDTMAESLFVIPGGLGSGTKVKMINQTLAGIHIAMASEAMGFAAALGLNTKIIYEVVKGSEGESWMWGNRMEHAIKGDTKIYSALNIIVKDMGIVNSVGRAERFPLFLSSATEQVFAIGVSAGYGLEDDSGIHRVYLPKSPSLVYEQTTSESLASTDAENTKLVIDMLKGVHLASAAESMALGKKVGLDTKSLYEIIQTAAGSSKMFVDRVPEMLSGTYKSGSLEDICASLKSVLDKATKMKYPLHLTGTALQMCELVRGNKDAEIIKLWGHGL